MTTKEKAKELVNKFMFTPFNIQENTDDFKFKILIQAKQCALIAVDEIINSVVITDLTIAENQFIYWEEVKQEIDKL